MPTKPLDLPLKVAQASSSDLLPERTASAIGRE
jgi:hypothetical protein